jgi:DNA-binding response OmpR family regulator
MDDYIAKPFTFDELTEKANHWSASATVSE